MPHDVFVLTRGCQAGQCPRVALIAEPLPRGDSIGGHLSPPAGDVTGSSGVALDNRW
jgi:hypothetical protein